jgi:hypothetical protein
LKKRTSCTHAHGTALHHLTESDLSGYLDQDLSADEKLRIETHLDTCHRCREEVTTIARLLGEAEAGQSVSTMHSVRGRGWRVPAGMVALATAAAIAALFLVGRTDIPFGQNLEQERFETEGMEIIAVHAPLQDVPVQRDSLRFVWADGKTESYRITITAEDGALVWSESVTDTVAAPSPSLEFAAGERYFWYVDAIGAGVVGRTGVQSFVVVP